MPQTNRDSSKAETANAYLHDRTTPAVSLMRRLSFALTWRSSLGSLLEDGSSPRPTAYFVMAGVLSWVTLPIAVWIAKRKRFERARLWVVSLRPYSALALLVVPAIILERAKPPELRQSLRQA
jgi:hypothetical protein